MRKSTLFLAAALTIPVVISLVGVASGLQGIAVSGHETKPPGQLLRDEDVPINGDFRLDTFASTINLSFDSTLKGKAHVHLEGEKGNDAKTVLAADHFTIQPVDHDKPLTVQIRLPATFDRLALTFAASDCELQGDPALKVTNFSLAVQASRSSVRLPSLTSQTARINLAAGSMDALIDALTVGSGNIDVGAGKLQFEVKKLAFTANGSRSLNITNASGLSEIHVDALPLYSLKAHVNAGMLSIERGALEENLAGFGKSREFKGPAGAPLITVELNTGKMQLALPEGRS